MVEESAPLLTQKNLYNIVKIQQKKYQMLNVKVLISQNNNNNNIKQTTLNIVRLFSRAVFNKAAPFKGSQDKSEGL